MKKILLTASTSFLGSKFKQLFNETCEITGLARSDKQHPVDMLNYEKLQNIYHKVNPDVLIHTAAVVDQDANKVRIPNIEGTKSIVQVAKIYNTPVILMSSESVYGGKKDIDEYTETDPYKPRSAYGETKVESEKIIITSNLPYLILRAYRFVGINMPTQNQNNFLIL